jgi:manganese/iron transport system permease protein
VMAELLAPFEYQYMVKAIVLSALVGGACAFLSAYLMMKGWSLIGDALGHSVVPGVAGAYMLKVPYAAGAFFAGLLAALGMWFVENRTRLRQDTIIGLVFTSFFALGLLMVSLNPMAVDVQTIVLGNILAISDEDAIQVVIIAVVTLAVMLFKWKDLMLVFFDEAHAATVGLNPMRLKVMFFTLTAAMTIAALQTVGACLVIAMVVTPGATAYLLADRFDRLLVIAVALGVVTGGVGAYVSYFLDGATGGVIVTLQTLIFLATFVLAPKHGILAARRKRQQEALP